MKGLRMNELQLCVLIMTSMLAFMLRHAADGILTISTLLGGVYNLLRVFKPSCMHSHC